MRQLLLVACLVAVAAAPAASADPVPSVDCIQVYREVTGPPASVTLVNGCTVEVEVETGSSGCLDRYVEYDLGAVRVTSRDSCHYTVRAAADVAGTRDTVRGLVSSGSGVAVGPGPLDDCVDIYREYHVGPVTVVQRGCDVSVDLGGLAAAQPNCLDVYWEQTVGPVRVVSPNSCTHYVYVGSEQVYPLPLRASGPECYYVYREYHVGPVTVIQRNSCAVPEVYVDGGAVAEPKAQSGPEPQCLYYYRDTDYGVVRHQVVSSCESHLWVAGEQVF